ncbi:MFS general substrate transporter [Westerdykella ornata]|uniref:MFS general substrate transporter n=1 Tax=Westerdykella ornata TaxID=318751 RepID=A0A6A6JTA7_WESOR|nr:MFS general substrate transporter [Westerdykella ornata]KAF2279597.1 MFS general substrate transporter [Westerdykella ornata]
MAVPPQIYDHQHLIKLPPMLRFHPKASASEGSNGLVPNTNTRNTERDKEKGANVEDRESHKRHGTYDRYIITEDDCYEELGYSWPTWKKWGILTIVFLVQVSMNFNTALYSNGITGISAEFGVSHQAARLGAALFLIFYAFGCELWAPWSEELGRFPVLQLSLFLVNIWQIPVALAPNFGTILAGRALGGLSTGGGSVTLAMVADMWEADAQQYAVAYIVFSSVGGSVLGPIVGGFVEEHLHWRWTIWIQLIFGGFVQLLHLSLVPETRSTILMDRIARRRRQEGDQNGVPVNIWGPNELTPCKDRFSMREILVTWIRPFRMFLTEPIVLCLSLLSGFSDAIIFMFLQSYGLVYRQWNFTPIAIGLSFIPIGIGYLLAWLSFLPAIKHNMKVRAARPNDERAQYENRLWWLLYTVPCLPVGLIIFAWTSTGPPIHWVGSMVASALIGIANYAIYMATIDYMICAYGPYSASATGGNGWSRDILAGVLTLPATPFYQNIPSSSDPKHVAYASTILFGISILLGPLLRERSPFAQKLAKVREETGGRNIGALPNIYGLGSLRQTEAAIEKLQERRRSLSIRHSQEGVREV